MLLLSMLSEFLRGRVRSVVVHNPFGYAVYGKVVDSLLVVVTLCGSQRSGGEYKTPYVETVKDDALCVFGPFKSCGTNSVKIKELSFPQKLILIRSLLKSGLLASVSLDCKRFDKIILLLEWLSWSLSVRWLHDYYLEKSLSDAVTKYNIQKNSCIHEMHSYARVVWRVAEKHQAKSYTIQHAAFS